MFGLILSAVFLLTPLYLVYKPPSRLINLLQRRWPEVLWHVDTVEKIVALTIDDSPSQFTEEITDIILANNASATFFVIGSQIEGYEETLREAVRHGNELANHAMYDEPSRSLTMESLISQIKTVQAATETIYTAAGSTFPPRYFRPGSGFFTHSMLAALEGLDYKLVLGNIFPFDPQIPFWRLNSRHILSMLQPGAIIICHDRREWTCPMLRAVLPEIARRGYKIVTITELLQTRPSLEQ